MKDYISQNKAVNLGISSPEVKLVRDILNNKKVIGADDLFVVEGLWATEKLVKFNIKIKNFLFCPDYIKTGEDENNVETMLKYSEASYIISDKACSKISEREGADGFFALCVIPKLTLDDIELSDNMVITILDGQEQPGNIGSIIRSLDCAGGQAVIITNRRVRLTNSRLIRASLGAAFTLPVIDVPMQDLVRWLDANKFKVFLTDLTASKHYYQCDYSGRVAIVSGNEFLGISKEWLKYNFCYPVIIPMFGNCESLNVGFATTLVAYEACLRQKGLLNRV